MTDRNIVKFSTRADTSEKSIERHLRDEVRARGGKALKFSSMTETGYPDRLCLLPCGLAFFAELKSKGRRPTEIQERRIAELLGLGFRVYVIDSRQEVDMVMDVMDTLMRR